MIKLIDVCKSFGTQRVLDELNLKIKAGRTTVIIGRSGGGKSVLLKHIIGLLKPDSGRILVDGDDIAGMSDRDLNEIRKRFGMLFQEAALFDSMTVGENVAFPLREHTRLKEEEIHEIVADRLGAVGLSGIEGKMPSELSGGMRKRVGLARAIALRPEIVLFDEPTTGLDPVMAEAVNQLIVETQKKFNLTCVVISHDVESIFRIAHRIAMLYEGRIIEEGTPEEIRASRNPVLKQFLAGRIEGPIQIL
ncbi:ABC transporter ATP-binding protein [Syntrophus aciditrophicus]|uniref:ABC-type transport system, ATP-binding component n=1 Tax=Syntrophus aciditrophicus (strain SB) TaxID=56780 RepID=Q2LS07_SYNAS|nr:ABC transporter ATP-binding protein [Syntrophus aciditrophicus]ABC76867.1 ABC-type transport system, ATP-binding component [Syntrophus aciditrophicus SB]